MRKNIKKFAKIYMYHLIFGFSMFIVFKLLEMKEILAVLGVGFISSLIFTYLLKNDSENKK